MKIVTKIVSAIDLKHVLMMTAPTVTRHVTLFIGAESECLQPILEAARKARELIRGDADMTYRLISIRPEKSQDYKEAWAMAAEKQMMNVYAMIKSAFEKEGREISFIFEGASVMSPDEINDWSTPAVPQDPHPGEPLIHDKAPEPEPEDLMIPEHEEEPTPI